MSTFVPVMTTGTISRPSHTQWLCSRPAVTRQNRSGASCESGEPTLHLASPSLRLSTGQLPPRRQEPAKTTTRDVLGNIAQAKLTARTPCPTDAKTRTTNTSTLGSADSTCAGSDTLGSSSPRHVVAKGCEGSRVREKDGFATQTVTLEAVHDRSKEFGSKLRAHSQVQGMKPRRSLRRDDEEAL
eukprot:3795509-Rhodomonas_salina.3